MLHSFGLEPESEYRKSSALRLSMSERRSIPFGRMLRPRALGTEVRARRAAMEGDMEFGWWTCLGSSATIGATLPFRRDFVFCVRVGISTGLEGVAADMEQSRSGFEWLFPGLFGTVLGFGARSRLLSCSREGGELCEDRLRGEGLLVRVAYVYDLGTIMIAQA